MSSKIVYSRVGASPAVRFYSSPGLKPAPRLPVEVFAQARESIAAWCLDGLVCAFDDSGARAVVLDVRANASPADGPFRGEPWVVGGRWDLVTPWEQFILAKARKEMFGGRSVEMTVGAPIGNQLFATGWGPDTDGPFGKQGVTLQFCYPLMLRPTISAARPEPDRAHSSIVVLKAGDDLSTLHPYIRDVIELSGWLRSV